MRLGRPLPRAFFARPCLDVAHDLIGCTLVRRTAAGARLAGRLVEVEAYLGDGTDPGSHAHRGETPRNRTMFGPPGHLYVYLSYGMHVCANLVAEPEGRAGGILLRAVEPILGIEAMQRRRGLERQKVDRRLAGGPGRLGQAFGIELAHDGLSAVAGEWTVRAPAVGAADGVSVERDTRIGLTHGAELPYRFVASKSPWLSRPVSGGRPKSGGTKTKRKPERRR